MAASNNDKKLLLQQFVIISKLFLSVEKWAEQINSLFLKKDHKFFAVDEDLQCRMSFDNLQESFQVCMYKNNFIMFSTFNLMIKNFVYNNNVKFAKKTN